MSNYPLCEKAGLTIYEGDGYIDDNIKADDVERALERLKCVYIEPEPKEPAVMPNLGNQSPELGDKEHDVELGELEFKSDDFMDYNLLNHIGIANRANAVLQQKLSRAPVVMAHRGPSNPEGVWIAKPYQDTDSTHTARLVAITPIANKTLEEKIKEILADHSKSAAAALADIRYMIEDGALLAKGGV